MSKLKQIIFLILKQIKKENGNFNSINNNQIIKNKDINRLRY